MHCLSLINTKYYTVAKKKTLNVQGINIQIEIGDSRDYISLTDIAKQRDDEARFVIRNWMSNRNTIQYLGVWEELHNDGFNRAGFRTVREDFFDTGSLTPKKWIENTQAIGIESRAGRYGGTFSHSDIAINFCYWLSPGFQVYFIKEFQRLKHEESLQLGQEFDVKRFVSKSTFSLLTSAIKENLVPDELYNTKGEWIAFAGEVDLLNEALFGQTAKEWKRAHPNKNGNMRDYASVEELIVLNVLQGVHALLIKWDTDKEERKRILKEVVDDFLPIIRNKRLKSVDDLKKKIADQKKR